MKPLKRLTGLLRKCFSHTPPKGSYSKRKNGISALILLRNEPFVNSSLLSIKDLVDEFIVVDCSTDDTPTKVKQVAKEHALNLKYFHMKPNITKQLKTAVKMSSYEWLLHWAGDFIAYTSGKRDIRQLKDITKTYPKDKFCFIEFSVLNVELDLLHTTKNPYHCEAYFFKYSPLLMEMSLLRILRKYISIYVKKRLPRRSPFIPYPLWYDRITLNQIFAMHLGSVKPQFRLLERKYDIIWTVVSDAIKQKFSNSFEEYFRYCIKRDYNKDIKNDKEEVVQTYIEMLKKERNLIPYNIEVYGDYPIVLKETFGVEISNTKEFRNKLTQFLTNKQ